MFQGLIIAIHVIACAGLIFFILIQQGKGGGLIDTLSSAESIFGTKTSTFLTKMTTGFAITFFFTCLILAFFSKKQSQSIITRQAIKQHKMMNFTPVKEETTKQTQTTSQVPQVQENTQPNTANTQNTLNTQPQTENKQTNIPQTTDAAKEPAATK